MLLKNIFTINNQIIISILILLVVLITFIVFPIDVTVQNIFYNFNNKTWMIQRNDFILKILFYTGPKLVLAFFWVACAIFYSKSNKINNAPITKETAFLMMISLIFVPLFIAFLKKITNVPTPAQLVMYGGNREHLPLFKYFLRIDCSNQYGSGYPAGHASGGFALMMFYFTFKKNLHRYAGLLAGLISGWIMGIYQMLRGQHFLSHTIISMIIAWILILIIIKIHNRNSK